MNKSGDRLFKLVLTALLAALVVGLQMINIHVGPFAITLTLIPIVFGSITLGAGYGAFLGLVFGLVVAVMSISGSDAASLAVFTANPIMAWVACLLKGVLAGLVPAPVFKLFNNRTTAPWVLFGSAGMFVFLSGFAIAKLAITEKTSTASAIVTVVASSLIAAAFLLIIYFAISREAAPVYLASMAAPIANTGTFIIMMLIFFRPLLEEWAGGSSVLVLILGGLVGVNFVIEFTVAVIFAPALAMAAKALMKRRMRN